MIDMCRWSSAVALILATLLLTGCKEDSDQTDKNHSAALLEPFESDSAESLKNMPANGQSRRFDCSDPSGMSSDKRLWCRALGAWQRSDSFSDSAHQQDEYIEAWKLGYLDAAQAKNPVAESLRDRPLAANGYDSGYMAQLDDQGIIEYDCGGTNDSDNEYRDRWCEGFAAYSKSDQGTSSNAVLRSIFINGYMSGKAIALTMPSSMESIFDEEVTAPAAGAKKPIDQPDSTTPRSVAVFYRGFNNGFQAMLDSIRESVLQLREQMQNMPGMGADGSLPGMEGLLPPDAMGR